MHLDNKTLLLEDEHYRSAPKAQIPAFLSEQYQISGEPQFQNVLSSVPYVPKERDQGTCGNCWVWTGAGLMEIAHKVKNGVFDRLSIQFFNSNYNHGTGNNWACDGGDIYKFSTFYNNKKIAIPWSNYNAKFADKNACPGDPPDCSGGTLMPASAIATNPRYDITYIQNQSIITQNVNQTTAIKQIKAVLDNKSGVYLAMRLPDQGARDAFQSFWKNKSEDSIWYMNSYENQPWTGNGGGHAVLVVGYNMTESDHKVVWGEFYSDSSAIKVKDLASSTAPTTVVSCSNYNFECLTPALSGNKVVWVEHFKDGSKAIKVKDLTGSNAPTTVVSSNVSFLVQDPALSGNKVVWVEYYSDSSAIKVKDLSSSNAPKTVVSCSNVHCQIQNPAISGNKVVWGEWYQNGSRAIKVKDLTGSNAPKTIASPNAMDPAISGNKVVWVEYYSVDSAIKVKDLTSSNAPTTVASCSNNQCYTPALSGNKVVWMEWYQDGSRAIKVKDLTSSNAPTTIVSSDVNYHVQDPGISGSPSWLILNSWGDTTRRPKGLFRMSMDMNYSGLYQNPNLLMTQWWTLNVSFKDNLAANFTANKTSGPAPLTVRFTDTSKGTPTTWNWTFGNGNTSTLRNPIFTYTKPGNYTVSLNVTRDGGFNRTVRTRYIVITPVLDSYTVLVPNGGNTWNQGSAQTIRWSYTGSPGPNVKIELLRGAAVNKVINASTTTGSAGAGSYQWTVPHNQVPGTDYKIRITSTTNTTITDKSNANFTISAGPPITVTVPNGGQNWIRGSAHTLTWKYTGNPGSRVKIELLKGAAVNRVINASTTTGSAGAGSYGWTIPANQVVGSDFRIRITSTSNAAYTDRSNANFTIGAP